MNNNVSPHIYVLSTLSVVILSMLALNVYGINDRYVIAPVIALAILYGIINLVRQSRGLSIFKIEKKPDYTRLVKKSIARYFVWLAIIFSAYIFYKTAPYYSTQAHRPNILFFEYLLSLYIIAGLPYFFFTGILKASRTEDFYDPAIRIIHIVKQFLLRLLRGDDAQSVGRVFQNKTNRKVLFNLLMRAYFIPVMFVQLYVNLSHSLTLSANEFYDFNTLAILYWITTVLWLTDITNASLSYGIESRWIENRSRSIDMTVTGWLVCLCCYAPLNDLTEWAFFFAPNVVTNETSGLIINNINFLYTIKIIEILLLSAHIYTDVSLGPSVANITLKKLQTKGFYGIIRHPGTTLKLTFWLFQSIFYKQFWQLKVIFGYIMWTAIYIARALTEERHLVQHEEYREYKKKVKYRFIPKIF